MLRSSLLVFITKSISGRRPVLLVQRHHFRKKWNQSCCSKYFSLIWIRFLIPASLDSILWIVKIEIEMSSSACQNCRERSRTKSYISCLMHGCQLAKPWCLCICKKEDMNDGTQYSPTSVQKMVQSKETVDKAEMNFKLTINKNERDKIWNLKN